jgi:hypothetical protein
VKPPVQKIGETSTMLSGGIVNNSKRLSLKKKKSKEEEKGKP